MADSKDQLKISALSFALQYHSTKIESTPEDIVATAKTFGKFLKDKDNETTPPPVV